MKVLFPTPVVWDGNDARYLQRDGARFAEEFTRRGDTGLKIIIRDDKGLPPPSSSFLLCASWKEWTDPSFWKGQQADFCLLYGGLGPQMEPVARAIRAAGIPLALKMDSADGILDFPAGELLLIRKGFWIARQTKAPVPSVLLSCARSVRRFLRPQTKFLERYLPLFDVVTAETEMALEHTRAWVQKHNVGARVEILPHPVLREFRFNGASAQKSKQVLAVAGNWKNPLKRGQVLADALVPFLNQRQDYRAVIVGGASDAVRGRALQADGALADRIEAVPALPPAALFPYYRDSQILAMPSGSEGAPNVVFEALCCGCSLVYGHNLKQLEMASSRQAGRGAADGSVRAFALALEAEAAAWDQGERNPEAISQYWTGRLHVDAVVAQLQCWVSEHSSASGK